MATLPSISSLLQLAGSNNQGFAHAIKNVELGAAKPAGEVHQSESSDDVPKPLTNEILQQALVELPSGTAQALQSCLSAFKMKRLSSQELVAFVRSVVPQSKALQSVFPEAQVTMGDKLAMPLGPLVLAAPSSLPGLDATYGAASSSGMLGLPLNLHGQSSPLMAVGVKRSMQTEHCESPKFSKTVVKEEAGRTQTAGEGAEGGGERHACAVQALMDLMSHDPAKAPAALGLPPPLSIPAHTESAEQVEAGRLSGLPTPPCLPLPSMAAKPLPLPASPAAATRPAGLAPVPHINTGRDFPPETATVSPRQPQLNESPPADKVDSPAASLSTMMDRTKLGSSSTGAGSPSSPSSASGAVSAGADADGSAHNKYCHFCQHIKVKRASSMLACENRGCNRRFCEHCLTTHLNDPRSSQEWRKKGAPWHCPICTKSCCCTMRECSKAHRHCKAYRYRRKRAQQAEMDKLTPEPSGHLAAFYRPPPFPHSHLAPPHLHFMPYPGFAVAPPPHPAMHPQAFHLGRR